MQDDWITQINFFNNNMYINFRYYNIENVIIYIQSVLQLFAIKCSAFIYKTKNSLLSANQS